MLPKPSFAMPYGSATPEYPPGYGVDGEIPIPDELSSETVKPGSLVIQTFPEPSMERAAIPFVLTPPPVYPFVGERRVPELVISR